MEARDRILAAEPPSTPETGLRALLSALARKARAGEFALGPERLAELGRALLNRGPARGAGVPPDALVERAGRRVHALRQASLLRGAVELRLALEPAARMVTAPVGPPPEHAGWWAHAALELDRTLRDGLELDGTLLGCALLPPAEWPAAAAIARAACALDPGVASRFCLARARFAAGEHARAEAGYRALLAGTDLEAVRGPLHEALACALERRGAVVEASAQFERAGLCGAGARAELGGLGLALVADARELARALADRLEPALEQPCELSRAGRELRARWELAGRFETWSARSRASGAWRELAHESAALHGALASELLESHGPRDGGARA